ncbi:MAG TPA: glycosyl hydrolase family 18 protein, partial [Chitinophagaceae bacterium]|nr:glycosyl hydrolase family 18 protein [Chitinophagaceae bacterium]
GNAATPNNLLSNQNYLQYVLRDARKVNPNIKFLATMIYSGNQTLAAIFSCGGDPQAQATAFANNLVAYLQANGMNGIDIDWEGDVANLMTQTQFQILFSTIRNVFDAQTEKYYLTMAPAWAYSTYDFPTLNSAFDIISPQFYDGTPLSEFLQAGMSPSKIGYGAQFEPGNAAPNASAQQVWNAVSSGFSYSGQSYNYLDIFMWRLNSGNFQFEQAQLMILSQLANPPLGNNFDDTAIVAAAGNPAITQMIIQSGEVLNAIQAVNTGTGPYNTGTQPPGTNIGIFTLLQHGGTSGGSQTINIPANDPIVSISGYTGVWYGWNCVLQLTLTGKSGKTYGPYGSMVGATSQTPFTQSGQSGQTVVAFKGSTVTVPLAGGGQTAIIASLNAVFA